MKFRFELSNDKEEIVAYAKKKNDLINLIENICLNSNSLLGYKNNEIKEINPSLVECFITYDEKIYALINKDKYQIKKRLYELSELLKDDFIYLNQSCLANVNLIDHFETNIGGAIGVIFKSGYKDYVSRRQLKNVKERLGLRK